MNSAFWRKIQSKIVQIMTPKLLLVLGTFFTATAYAHVRWFTTPVLPLDNVTYSFAASDVQIWAAIGVALVVLAIICDFFFPDPKFQDRWPVLYKDAVIIMRVFTGVSLFLTAYHGNIIAPHIYAHGWLGGVLIALELIVGILFIADRFMFHAASLLLLIWLGTWIEWNPAGDLPYFVDRASFLSVFEYMNIIGISLFFMFTNFKDAALLNKYKSYSVDALRIFTGIALLTLGLTEKLLPGALGQAFIAQHPTWNFMLNPEIFNISWYSNSLFVLSAGTMEVVFGTIMILGVVTRVNTLVVAVFMLLSNIVFLFTPGTGPADALTELIGHMPIIGSALVLLCCGYGEHIKLTNLFRCKKKAA